MKSKENLLVVSDDSAAFLVPTMQYLIGMQVASPPPDENWSLEEVEYNIRNRGDVVLLVLHPGNYRDDVLHLGPRVSKALYVSVELKKCASFLVPMEEEVKIAHNMYEDLVVKDSDGNVLTFDKRYATSDIRIALASLSLVGEAKNKTKEKASASTP
jgi:hypothetical protein